MFWLYSIVLALSTFLMTFASSAFALNVLKGSKMQDVPNERSNHSIAVPRGGGVAVMVALGCFLLIAGTQGLLLWAMIGVAIISFADDWTDVPALQRLAVHFAAACLALMALHGPVFQGLLPFWADHLVAVFLLTFWLNLYNFMDGIDGITGAQTVALGLGLVVLSAASGTAINVGLGVDGMLLAVACIAFLMFNWHPAKMFLGDVGSAPLGILTGFYMMELASYGYWEAALILPAYYLADGGYTLAKRALKGEKIWEAHSQHAYQQAVRNHNSHDEVVRWIMAGNLVLLVLAMLSTREGCGVTALILAMGVAAALRWKLTVLRPTPEILPPAVSHVAP